MCGIFLSRIVMHQSDSVEEKLEMDQSKVGNANHPGKQGQDSILTVKILRGSLLWANLAFHVFHVSAINFHPFSLNRQPCGIQHQ